MAAEGSQKNPDREDIDLRVPADTLVTGAALVRTGQSLIYRHLTSTEDVKCLAARQSIKKVKSAVREIFGETPTDEGIWRSIRHKDITRKIRDFLWKHMHGIYRLGKFWDHIPGCEDRVECPLCNKYDTFDHIITECVSVKRSMVWHRANQLWRRRHNEDLPLSEGAILGGGLANFRKADGKPDHQ